MIFDFLFFPRLDGETRRTYVLRKESAWIMTFSSFRIWEGSNIWELLPLSAVKLT